MKLDNPYSLILLYFISRLPFLSKHTFTTLSGQDITVNSAGGAVTVFDGAGNTANYLEHVLS